VKLYDSPKIIVMTRSTNQQNTEQGDAEQQPDKEIEENQRPKREINKSHCLKDFV